MSSKPITVEMAHAIHGKVGQCLWARTTTELPGCFSLERFEHLLFEREDYDELHDRYVAQFGSQYNGSTQIAVPWVIPLPNGDEMRSSILLRSAGRQMRYPPGEHSFYRDRDPELFEAWHRWLASVTVPTIEALIGCTRVRIALEDGGVSGKGWRYNRGLITSTAQLRDTWPELMNLDRSGRTAGLREAPTRPNRVELPPRVTRWMPKINDWLLEGAMIGTRGSDMSDTLSFPDGTGSLMLIDPTNIVKDHGKALMLADEI